jgi:hypothetical protein
MNSHLRRGAVLLLGLVSVGCFAGQALAGQQDPSPSTGNIEVCKQSAAAPLAVTGLFNFTITDSHGSTYHVSVPASAAGAPLSCSAPIAVASGAATVVEAGNPWSAVTSIADLPGASVVSGVNLGTGTATVAVTAGSDASHTATVVYTDQLVTGVVEVCKSAVTGSGLTGTYTFSITGADGFSASTGPVPIGACSTAITVPAGSVTVQEGPLPVDVTAISATSQGSNVLTSSSLATGSAVVGVQAGDATKQSLVNFTDDVTTLKLCKAWDGPATTTGPYPFTFGVTGVAGPAGPTAGLSLAAGTVSTPNCVIVGQYRAGTQVAVTEGVVPGTKVESIAVNPTGNAVPGSLSTTNRTVTVSMGAGETVVTYVDEPAIPGTLKICKAGGTPAPRGTSFDFTVSGVVGTIAVPLGSCVVVGGSLTPTQFPFNSTLTIVEAPSTGNSVFSIGVVGTTVAGSSNTATGTVQVVIGENTTTEVTYTNIDPPDAIVTPVVTPAPVVTSAPAAASSSSNSSSDTSSPTPSVVSSSAPNVIGVPAATGVTAGLTLGSTAKSSVTATKAALTKALKLASLKKQLATLKMTEKKLVAHHAAAKTLSAKHALAAKIAATRAAEKKIALQIALLK